MFDNTPANPPVDFYKQKISIFKDVSAKHPEMLAEWRAQRAADFVSSHKNAVDPPMRRELSTKSFRPGGILPATTAAGAAAAAGRAKKTSMFGDTGSSTAENDVGSNNNSNTSGDYSNTNNNTISHSKPNLTSSASLLSMNMQNLTKELKNTEEQLARQELKIKLNTRATKHFELGKDAGRNTIMTNNNNNIVGNSNNNSNAIVVGGGKVLRGNSREKRI